MSTIPRLGVTAGEPAGIGPELVVKLAQHEHAAELIAIGDARQLRACAERLDLTLRLRPFDPQAARAVHRPGEIACIDVPLPVPPRAGTLDRANASQVVAMLDVASRAALERRIDGIVTAPVHKGIVCEGGVPFSGHTEFFAERAGVDVVMLLAAPRLRVALATTHLPLSAVPAAITRDGLIRTLRVLHADLVKRFGLAQPRITVLGLNPHAGEGGHLGREEIDTIAPALALLRAEGMQLNGPLPADTAFIETRLEYSDAFLAMYHDQGLPVLKALGFGDAVNVTLGLPYVRTSVDHGVALDVAGSGRADVASLVAATRLACRLATPAVTA